MHPNDIKHIPLVRSCKDIWYHYVGPNRPKGLKIRDYSHVGCSVFAGASNAVLRSLEIQRANPTPVLDLSFTNVAMDRLSIALRKLKDSQFT